MAIDHRMIEIDSTGMRLTRSTTSPTGITATAATISVTELSSPIWVLSRCSELSSWGATAPIVEIWALERASTPAKRTTTRVRAVPPTAVTTRPRRWRHSQCSACPSAATRSWSAFIAPPLSQAVQCPRSAMSTEDFGAASATGALKSLKSSSPPWLPESWMRIGYGAPVVAT